MMVLGLVVDGGRAFAERGKAMAYAEEAARAGAGAVSASELYQGHVALDPAIATSGALAYLRSVGASGSVVVRGNDVIVHAQVSEPTYLLSMVGIRTITQSATATATNISGVTEGS